MARRAGALALLALPLVACTGSHAAAPGPPGSAVVVRPVDGDTIIVKVGHAVERVRLLGIDTPESVSPSVPVECFGPEAKHRTAELLPPGTHVLLQRDLEARDKYDRLLAYVTRADDGAFVNLELVQEGYAEAFPFAPNTAHEADFARAEAGARAARRGLWPACGGTDTPEGRAAPVASSP